MLAVLGHPRWTESPWLAHDGSERPCWRWWVILSGQKAPGGPTTGLSGHAGGGGSSSVDRKPLARARRACDVMPVVMVIHGGQKAPGCPPPG